MSTQQSPHQADESPRPILVIGPYPPPVHGFSVITQALADRLEGHCPVIRCNLAAPPSAGWLRTPLQMALAVRAALAIVGHRLRGGRSVSMGVNGGLGLVYNLLLVLAARASGQRLYLHHHSYGYINRRSTLIALLDRMAGRQAIHVFLAPCMAASFRQRYPGPGRDLVLPNAIFVPPAAPAVRAEGMLRAGLLSNLSREKGLHDFLATAARLKALAAPVEMILAGPAPLAEDRSLIEAAVARGEISWRGPLYGADKQQFFADIDVFLFPTRYVFEAQPTVIYEAFAAGAGVVAFDRGAIRDQVRDCLLVVPDDVDFAAVASDLLRTLAGEGEERLAGIAARARQLHADDSRLGAQVVAGMAR
ncbi:glycosyltransferase family 4 protein [Zavarzinia sp. CC-PAN008]|uniref:glycosyltransferase family 4 protein n=1 Tax=Zavarzinia sp. CC-PAN008 TaxID=3243332 RepID=UPI003F745EA7